MREPTAVVVIGAGSRRPGRRARARRARPRGDRARARRRARRQDARGRRSAARRLDAGPTVFTMRWVFEELFADAGAALADHLTLRPVEILARHAWSERERLDLFADVERSADAIGAFAGPAEARRYPRVLRARAPHLSTRSSSPFIRAPRPEPARRSVAAPACAASATCWQISPFATLWRALGEHFHDPRLRQLFGRYATYCGSSPFLAPATLMLVAHVEQDGRLAGRRRHAPARRGARRARRATAARRSATARRSREVVVERRRASPASGSRAASGSTRDAVIVNADVAARRRAGCSGAAVARAVPRDRAGAHARSRP